MMETEVTKNKVGISNKIISYLVFTLGGEHFALNVAGVINILELQPITKVPKSPEYMSGVINLRGEVLPVIDTNIKLNQGATNKTDSTCILVVEVRAGDQNIKLGLLVDSVQEVLEFEDHEILPPPSIADKANQQLISGVFEYEELLIMLLDINRLLDSDESFGLKELTKNNKTD